MGKEEERKGCGIIIDRDRQTERERERRGRGHTSSINPLLTAEKTSLARLAGCSGNSSAIFRLLFE